MQYLIIVFLSISFLSCTQKEISDPLVAKGRQVYMAQCISCHSPDPKKAGSLGPAVHGSSAVLIEARVLRGEYPPGYQPKATSTMMVPMPNLEAEIEALTAFLNAQ